MVTFVVEPKLAHDPLFQPAVINVRQGMTTYVPLQLWSLDKVPTGAELHDFVG